MLPRLTLVLLACALSTAARAAPDPLDVVATRAPGNAQLVVAVDGAAEWIGVLAARGGKLGGPAALPWDIFSVDGWRQAGFDLSRPGLFACRGVMPVPRCVSYWPIVDEKKAIDSMGAMLALGYVGPVLRLDGRTVWLTKEPDGGREAWLADRGYLVAVLVGKGEDKDALDELGSAVSVTPAKSLAAAPWWQALRASVGPREHLFAAVAPGLAGLGLAALGPNPLTAGLATHGAGATLSVAKNGGMRFALATLDDPTALVDRVTSGRSDDDFATRVAGKPLFALRATPALAGRTVDDLLALPGVAAALDKATETLHGIKIDLDLRRDVVPALGPQPSLTLLGVAPTDGAKKFWFAAALRFGDAKKLAALVEKGVLPARQAGVAEATGQDGIVWYTLAGSSAFGVVGDRLVVVAGEQPSALAVAHAMLAAGGPPSTAQLPAAARDDLLGGPAAFAYLRPELMTMMGAGGDADDPNPLASGPSQMRLGRRGAAVVFDWDVDGDVLGMAIASFRRYLRRSKETEARSNVRQLEALATAYWETERPGGPKLPPSTPWTPSVPACKRAGHELAPDAKTWDTPAWRALGFSVDEHSRFQYRVVSGKGQIDVEARGDLDCDGRVTTVRAHGRVDENRALSWGDVEVDGGER